MANHPLEANDTELLEQIRLFARQQSVMTLAVAGDRGPWAAAVLYAVDVEAGADLPFYFLSSHRSQHVAAATPDGRISAEIHRPYQDWQSILGIQMRGLLTRVAANRRDPVERLYHARYPEIRALVEAPRNDDEGRIALAFQKSDFFRLSPNFIRLVDNRAGFGTRTELHLSPSQ